MRHSIFVTLFSIGSTFGLDNVIKYSNVLIKSKEHDLVGKLITPLNRNSIKTVIFLPGMSGDLNGPIVKGTTLGLFDVVSESLAHAGISSLLFSTSGIGGSSGSFLDMTLTRTRAETPTGVIVSLNSPATDALGRTGFNGVVDTQFWTRFSGTILLSIIDDALAIAANQSNGNLDNTSSGARDLATIELESTINVPVILRKPQGEEVAVMVARDLDFSSVYRLKVGPHDTHVRDVGHSHNH